MRHSILLIIVFGIFYSLSGSSQTLERVKYGPYQHNTTFNGGSISDMAYSDLYGLFAVGYFDSWGIKTGRIAKLNEADATPDTKFPRIYDNPKDIISDGNGGWFVGGFGFTNFNEGVPLLAAVRKGTLFTYGPTIPLTQILK